jgi:hypothetical protein
MSDGPLYLAIGLPSFVAFVGILMNVGYFVALNGRMTRVEDKLDVLTGKVAESATAWCASKTNWVSCRAKSERLAA